VLCIQGTLPGGMLPGGMLPGGMLPGGKLPGGMLHCPGTICGCGGAYPVG
jgi:elastin